MKTNKPVGKESTVPEKLETAASLMGKASAESFTPEQRTDRARKAANAKWRKKPKDNS